MSLTVLVYGWYNKGNVGDDLFIEAFRYLFPYITFVFVDRITSHNLQGIDAVIIGGGSFLNEPLLISEENLKVLKDKKIMYIGVGAETTIHPMHQELMGFAKLVAIRTPQYLDMVKKLNPNSIATPDIVYCLPFTQSKKKIPKSVLVLPNISVVPKWNEPHWKHVAWEYFKSEFAQFIDQLLDDKYTVSFFPMCSNPNLDDTWATAEIVNKLIHRNSKYFLEKKSESAIDIISQYSVCISQRYHGIVLAEMSRVPCLSIYHHDKLKSTQGPNVSYYEVSKSSLLEHFNNAVEKNYDILPIDSNIFSDLKQKVEDALCRR